MDEAGSPGQLNDAAAYCSYVTGVDAEMMYQLGDRLFDGFVDRHGLHVYLRAFGDLSSVPAERDLRAEAQRDVDVVALRDPGAVVEWHCRDVGDAQELRRLADGTGVQVFHTPMGAS